MKNKLLIFLIAIIYIPFALIFSIVWGLIGGIIGTLIGTFQDCKKLIINDYYQWRYMPKTSAHKWWAINNEVAAKDRPEYEKVKIMKEVDSGKRFGPHPIAAFLFWIFYYLILLILIRLPLCIISGPVYAGIDAYDFFLEKILKQELKIIINQAEE